MPQTNTVYDPDADEQPVRPHSPADEDELRRFRDTMAESSLGPEDESHLDSIANGIEGGEDGLFNKDGDKGADTKTDDKPNPEGLYNESDGNSRRDRARKRLKSTTSKLSKNKLLIGGGVGAGSGVILVIVLLVVFVSSLKLPDVTQNIEAYEFANVTAEFAKSAERVTDEDLATESLSDSTWTQLQNKFLGPIQDKIIGPIQDASQSVRDSTWGKLDVYRPSQVMKSLGEGDNGLSFTYKRSLIPGRGDIWTGGSYDGESFTVKPVEGIANWIPGIRTILRSRNEYVTRAALWNKIGADEKVSNLDGIVRFGLFKRFIAETNGNLAGWPLKDFGNSGGESDPLKAQATATAEMEQASLNGESAPDPAVTQTLNDAAEAEKSTLEADAENPKTVEAIIADGGEDAKADAASEAALNPSLETEIAEKGDPLLEATLPACIAFDGSIKQAGPTISNQMAEQENVFDQLAAEADQQKNGDTNTSDSTELANAIGGTSGEIGQIDQSIPIERASSGVPPSTAAVPSAEASADGGYAYSLINALTNIPNNGLESDFINWLPQNACPFLTNTDLALGIGIVNAVGGIVSLGTDTAVEEGAAEAADLSLQQFMKNVVSNGWEKLTATTTKTVTGKVTTKKVESTGISRAEDFIVKQGLVVGATFATTDLAHIIVAAKSGEENSGFAQGAELVNEADSGANIEAGEVCRQQLFCEPLTPEEVTQSELSSTKYVLADNASKSFNERYFALSNPDSLFSHLGIDLGADLNTSSFTSLFKLGSLILKPLDLLGVAIGSLGSGHASAANDVDPGSVDYGNIQFGWTTSEETLIDSSGSYEPLENQYILDTEAVIPSGYPAPDPLSAEDAIAQTYAPCFGYSYDANGNGDLDPTDTSGNLVLNAGAGQAGSLGNLLANTSYGLGGSGSELGIARDNNGNVLQSQGLCSPDNLGPNNNLFGPQMVFRWRLAMQYDTTLDQLTGEQTVTGTGGSSPSTLTINNSAAQQAAQTSGAQVGYALYDSGGNLLASYDATNENYGASITKSLLLVSYLDQVGTGTLSSYATTNLTGMIEQSNDQDSDNIYHLLKSPMSEINAVAQQAGMTGFKFDTSDPLYVLGQSQVTALDFAKFFSRIDVMLPSSQRKFALSLLSDITPQGGILQAGLPGTVYSKEGWKPEPGTTNPFGSEGTPYVVNQAAQFTENGTVYGIAVTVGGTTNEQTGETIIENVVKALLPAPSAATSQTATL